MDCGDWSFILINMSVKIKYGLCVMLALAKSYGQDRLKLPYVAKSYGIPQNYLEQIISELKRAGLVTSFRGAQGGYALNQGPETISVASILEVLEGPLDLVSGQKGCDQMVFFWEEVEAKIKAIFNLTLADLIVKQDLHKQKMQKMLTYSI